MAKKTKVPKWQRLSEIDYYETDGWVLSELVWKRKLDRDSLEKLVLPHDLPKGEKHQCHEHVFSLRWFTGTLWTEIGPIDSELVAHH